MSIGGNDVSYIGSNQGLTDYYFNAWVTDKLGEVYVSRTTPSYYNEGSQWFANLFFHVGSGDKDAEITFYSNDGDKETYLVKDLCPYPFGEEDLK